MTDISAIRDLIGNENVKEQEEMSRHTTFRTGGRTDLFLTPEQEKLPELIRLLNQKKIPYYIIGNGSNLLVKDEGYRGAVIHIGSHFETYRVQGTEITAGAGIKLSKIASIACREGLTGLEFASGIPGLLGGAITMNAGAYGGEMSQVLTSVKVMDRDGNIMYLQKDELNLGYRHSIVMEEGYLVLEAVMSLEKGNPDEIHAIMEDFNLRRREKQPLEYPSAGSTFKRPEGYFAGKLIMDAGLAGKSIGGAQVSEKHCGFVINKDNATATDILELMEEVSDIVYKKYKVRLEPEVKILG